MPNPEPMKFDTDMPMMGVDNDDAPNVFVLTIPIAKYAMLPDIEATAVVKGMLDNAKPFVLGELAKIKRGKAGGLIKPGIPLSIQ
jgi:hypothetical protein